MNDNDLICPNLDELIRRRDAMEAVETEENLIGAMDSVWDGSFKRTKRAAVRVIAGVPAVPQEMSAREYEKVKDRMRVSNDNAYGLYVRALFEGQIDEAIAIIKKWAREHPERSEE